MQLTGFNGRFVVQASNLALPCREMCESVVSTCSCSKERKFGDLLEKVDAAVSSGSASGLVGQKPDEKTKSQSPKGLLTMMLASMCRGLCVIISACDASGYWRS